MKSGLYIVATPIGNMGDISPRAVETLHNADVIACEDTRISKKLLSLLGISLNKTFITLHDHNEDRHLKKIISVIKDENKSVALISDAGSPLISDPGYKLIRACRDENIFITTIPGCCALICALQLSGLPTNRFLFAGFLPVKDKARQDAFLEIKNLKATVVFYETAGRIVKTLETAQEVLGGREMAVAREISKIYEECITGTAEELIRHFSERGAKGEMVLMIAPAEEETTEISRAEMQNQLRQKLQTASLKSAVKEIVEEYGANKNEIYEMALGIKNEK